MKRKIVSVGAELAVLYRAIEAAEDLLDVEKISNVDTDAAGREAAAVLALVASRLAQLRRAITGAEDPASLHARHNEADDGLAPGDDPDVLLMAWDPPPRPSPPSRRPARSAGQAGRA